MPLTIVVRDRKSRRRRRFRWLALGFIGLIAFIFSLPYWAPGLFKASLEQAIVERIDRPTRIGDLDVRMFPSPALIAQDVAIGHPEFNVRADRVTLQIVLTALARRVADIPSIQIEGLVWTVPEAPGDLAQEINDLEFRTKGKGRWKGIVRRVFANDARIEYVGSDESVLEGQVEALDLLENVIALNVDAFVPAAGKLAALTGKATLERKPGASPSLGVTGSAVLSGVESKRFVNEDVAPNTRLDFDSIEFERTGADRVTITMNGHSSAASSEAFEVEALAGTFSAIATWEDGETGIRIDEWRAPGFEFAGDIAVNREGGVALAIASGSANAAGIDAYFKLRPIADYTVTPRPDGALRVSGLRVNRSADGMIALVDGNASFSGIDLLVEDGAQAFAGFGGEIAFLDNVITLERVSGEGLSLAGTIALDFAAETYRFDLNGETVLTPERIRGLLDAEWLTDVAGALTVAKLQGTAGPEGGVPSDLVLEGALAGGRFHIESEDWTDTMEQIELTFAAAEDQIQTRSTAQSEMFGTLGIDGVYSTSDARWSGTVSGNLADVQLPSLEGTTREIAAATLDAFGQSDLDLAVSMPNEIEGVERVTLDATRRGDGPAITARIVLDRADEAWALGDVSVDAMVPSGVTGPMAPDSVATAGPMAVQFTRSALERRFRANVDLAAANVSMGDHVTKRAGAPLALAIEGRAINDDWAAEVIDITLLDTNVRGTLDDDRFRIASLDVDLASLAPLLGDGGSASGRVTGSIQSNPTDVDLALNSVRLALSEELVADNIDGRVRVTDAGIETDGLTVDAANSNFTLSLREENNRWTGGIRGTQIDADALMRFADEYRALFEEEVPPDVPDESGQSLLAAESDPQDEFSQPIQDDAAETLEGEFNVDIDAVKYRNATLSNVRTRLVASGGNVSANDVSFVPGTGTASGNMRYARGAPPLGNRVTADIVFEGVDAKVIDDLAFETPRNLRGALTGNAMLAMPIKDGGIDVRGLGGSVEISGENGSLGSLGFANAILFVFKTTEILFLRSPFGEGGLSFDELKGKATMESGVITLGVYEDGLYQEAITLQRPSYRMSAIGWIDLPGEDSEVIVHMQPLSSVTDAARIFKVDEVEVINNKGGIRIRMTGPPTDPKTQIALGGPVNAITNEIRGGFKSVTGVVRDQILEGIGGLLREVLER